ncbi:hypothetical protein [Paraglaciecola marina]|uniref:hypothetical protein n=1 Tax=Paraglaciecola marina TaxID=2500157 RepID=UPI00105B51C4|nr:hypothetical protein [Paraglaciecola marina]
MRYLVLKIIAITLFLTGCGSTTIQSTQISSSSELPIGNGVVAVQVINNTDRLASLHKGWTEIIVIRTDNMDELKQIAIDAAKAKAASKGKAFDPDKVDWDPEIYSLAPNNMGVIDSQLFVGSMPEGTYMISSLYSFFSNGDLSSWLSMPVYQAAGNFEVKENRFTNLGSLVFQPLLNVKEKSFWSNRSSQKAYVTRLNDTQDFTRFILSHYPNLSENINFEDTLSWTADDLDTLRQKLGELSRENAYGERASYLNTGAMGAIAARFGQLKILQEDGEWLQNDLPTNGQLSSVIELGNTIAVGSERGLIFVKESQAKDWTELQPVAAKEAIVWFGQGVNKHYALTSEAMDYHVYEFESLTTPWKHVGNFKKKNKNDWLVQNGGLFPWIKADGSLRVINDNKVYDYSSATGAWNSTKTNSLVKLEKLRSGALVGLEVSQWDGVGDQVYSLDDGQTWHDINRNLKLFGDAKSDISLPTILADNTIVTVARVRKNSTKSSELKIVTAAAADTVSKNDWQAHGLTQDTCHTLLPMLTYQQTLFFLCDKGEVISTKDFGETWQTEFDIDLDDMQKKFQAMLEVMKEQESESEVE